MCVHWRDDQEFNSILQRYTDAKVDITWQPVVGWQPVTVVLQVKKCVYLVISQFQKAGFQQHKTFLKVFATLR